MYKNLLAIFAGLVGAFLVLMVIENTIPPFFQVAPPAPNLPKPDFEAYINSLPEKLLMTNAISYGMIALGVASTIIGGILPILLKRQTT